MKQSLIVEMDDGSTLDIDSDARDVRAWEAEYGQSWMKADMSFTTLAQLAYLAGRRTGVFNGRWPTYTSFDDHCVDARGRPIAPLVANPTRQARTDDSSVSSRATSTRSRRK